MHVSRVLASSLVVLAGFACDLEDAGRGRGGAEGGESSKACTDACAKLAECFAEQPDLVSPFCAQDCDEDLAGPGAAATQACIDCLLATPCAAAFPTDGTEGSCAEACR